MIPIAPRVTMFGKTVPVLELWRLCSIIQVSQLGAILGVVSALFFGGGVSEWTGIAQAGWLGATAGFCTGCVFWLLFEPSLLLWTVAPLRPLAFAYLIFLLPTASRWLPISDATWRGLMDAIGWQRAWILFLAGGVLALALHRLVLHGWQTLLKRTPRLHSAA